MSTMTCRICGNTTYHCENCHRAYRAAIRYQPTRWERFKSWWYQV